MLSAAGQADAVILYAKAQRNTKPPNGSLLNSGWQWQGRWGVFSGTAIGKKYFITSEHVGGKIGDRFIYNNVWYRTINTYDDPDSDLQIWMVKGRITSWAPLMSDGSEAGRMMVVFGRGTQRGAEVSVNGELKGWQWSTFDHVQSWGKNIIAGTAPGLADEEAGGAEISDALLYWAFDRQGISHEATVSAGDSGGGVFVNVDGVWRLAAVSYSTQSEFSYPGSDEVFNAALFDTGGMKSGGQIIPDAVMDKPTVSFATRISSGIGWIRDVMAGRVAPSASATPGLGVPEPGGMTSLVGLLSLWFLRLRRRGG